jgi:hypothetical protein
MTVVAYRGEEVRPLGTCFGISSHGLALTARHVVDDALSLGPIGQLAHDGQWWLGALYVRERAPGEDVEDLFGGMLPARKVHLCADLDIAVIALDLPINTASGESLHLSSLRLSPGLPTVGQPCWGLGYHSMNATVRPDKKYHVELFQSYSATRGVIDEIHFPRRDAGLSFPCFRTSARFDGGMSGGPIMDMKGNAIGVICSSFGAPEDGGHISYGSLIGPALLIQVEAKFAAGETGMTFLHDFVLGGSVELDAAVRDLQFIRESQRLTLDFGSLPRLSNVLVTP